MAEAMRKSNRGAAKARLSKREREQFSSQQIANILGPFGISPSPALTASISAYLHLLWRWNQKVNLTAIREPQLILQRHFGESFFASPLFAGQKGVLVDVGSGAGFPGLALKLVLPGWQVQLFESNGKKAVFLAEVVRTLGLSDVTIRSERMEKPAVGTPDDSLCADVITARALGEYEVLLNWSRGRLSSSGKVILWVGGAELGRLRQIHEWNWRDAISIPQSKDRFLLVGTPKV